MNDGINYGVDNQPNELKEVDMNMLCVSLDGKIWTNLEDAMKYNETYYNRMLNEYHFESAMENDNTNVSGIAVDPSELNQVEISSQQNSYINDKLTIKPFKSLDGKEWGNIDQAVEYNKLYYEKMRIKDNLIIDEEKHGFGTR